MNLMVIGLGSMGKRRIALLTKYFPDIMICGVDMNPERRKQTAENYQINLYEDINSAIAKEMPGASLVCTSPESHGRIILECIRKGLHVFSEINLLPDHYEQILKNAKRMKVKLFLSSTLLYRKEIEIIKGCVLKQKSKVNYRYHVGQYLPDWHPWEKDKDFFVWNKKTNGCREIFAIDLPWIIQTFGKVKDIIAVKDNISTLAIEYPDNYLVVVEHENGNKGVLLVDIVSRKAVRELLVYSESLYLIWSGTPSSLYQYNMDKKSMEVIETYSEIETNQQYADYIIENAYLEELNVFLDKIKDQQNKDRDINEVETGLKERYTFEEDLYTLQLIDRIEGIEK